MERVRPPRLNLPSYQLERLKFDHTDIRFTTKGDTLYAIALGWPSDRRMLIKSLAEGSPNYVGQISRVELLGSKSQLKWTRTAEGLEMQLWASRPVDMPFHSKSKLADPAHSSHSLRSTTLYLNIGLLVGSPNGCRL